MAHDIFIHPGYSGSNYDHWQSHWEREHPEYIRIQQRDWLHPVADEWAATIEQYLQQATEDTIVVTHSLGCLALVHWAQKTSLKIKGALLVAPPDYDDPRIKPFIQGFDRIKKERLPFKSILLASSNDEYMTIDNASELASTLGSTFVNLGERGHINAKSNLGNWLEGQLYLNLLVSNS
jgi:uncharacterized protein